MKCDDCPVGGQHDYGTSRFNPLDNPHYDFPIGRAYPAQVDGTHKHYLPQFPSDYPVTQIIVNTNPIPVFAEPARKGWICPRCDNAVSPDEKVCPHCKPRPKKESDNGKRTHITEAD
jgi:hypothetical protein